MAGSSLLCVEVFPSAFGAVCLLQSWPFIGGKVSLKDNLQQVLGAVSVAGCVFMAVLVMCEGWKGFEGEPKEPVKQLSWTSPWRIGSFPSTPAAKM